MCSAGCCSTPSSSPPRNRPRLRWPDTVWQIALLYPLTAITVKRFKDADRPAWLGYWFAPFGVALYLGPHIRQLSGPLEPATLVAFVRAALRLFFVRIHRQWVRPRHRRTQPVRPRSAGKERSGRMTDIAQLLTTFQGRISRKQWWIGFVDHVHRQHLGHAAVQSRDYSPVRRCRRRAGQIPSGNSPGSCPARPSR